MSYAVEVGNVICDTRDIISEHGTLSSWTWLSGIWNFCCWLLQNVCWFCLQTFWYHMIFGGCHSIYFVYWLNYIFHLFIVNWYVCNIGGLSSPVWFFISAITWVGYGFYFPWSRRWLHFAYSKLYIWYTLIQDLTTCLFLIFMCNSSQNILQ